MDFLTDSVLGNSLIISAAALAQREGMNLQKSMNFRDNGVQLSVFLVLEREGMFTDVWDEKESRYSFEGHDSVAEGATGRSDDQLLMYASGKPTDNGKFYKAAHAFVDSMRDEPLQVQIYEKLDPGVWFDKGIFNLIDATFARETHETGSRKVARFVLVPADVLVQLEERIAWRERMVSASIKAGVWQRDSGRCSLCGEQSSLHFKCDEIEPTFATTRLVCNAHFN